MSRSVRVRAGTWTLRFWTLCFWMLRFLAAWAYYLIAGWIGAGWAGCVILLLATSLGVALISLWLPERGQARHPPAVLIAAHGVLAVTTITLVLATLGSG
jgi:hypothetical protein